MSKPIISIITALYNSSSTLQKCIDSVAGQSWLHKEHILIDGGSIDGTVDIIKNNENKINYWESSPDRGIYHAWNKGMQHANGEWILFLGADDVFYDEEVLKTFVKKITSLNETPYLAYGNISQIDEHGQIIRELGEPWINAKVNITQKMTIPHPGCFHHKNLFAKFGIFDERFKIAGDYDMILRFVNQYPPVYLTNFIVTKMQFSGISNDPSCFYKVLLETKKAQINNEIASFSLRWHGRVFKHFIKHLYFRFKTP